MAISFEFFAPVARSVLFLNGLKHDYIISGFNGLIRLITLRFARWQHLPGKSLHALRSYQKLFSSSLHLGIGTNYLVVSEVLLRNFTEAKPDRVALYLGLWPI